MSGISYNLSEIQGIALDIDGVLSPTVIPLDEEGVPMRKTNLQDEYAIKQALAAGVKLCVISSGHADSFAKRLHYLGVTDVYLCVKSKREVLERWMTQNGLGARQTAYMGDDIPDLGAMRKVDLPTCPHDAAYEVKASSIYISPFTGGHGCVRDLLRQILIARNKWL